MIIILRFSPILVKLKTFQNRWNEVLRTQLVAILTKVMNFELYFFFLDKLSFISGYVLKAVCVAVNIVLKLSR